MNVDEIKQILDLYNIPSDKICETISKKLEHKTNNKKLIINKFCKNFKYLKLKLFKHQIHSIEEMIEREVNPVISVKNDIGINDIYLDDCEKLTCKINGTYKINTNIGILGNEPGSGKTLTVLGLISKDNKISKYFNIPNLVENKNQRLEYSKIKKNIYQDNSIYITHKSKYKYVNCNLIVVPHGGVFRQWKKAIQTQTHLCGKYIENTNDFQKFIDINDCDDLEIIKRFSDTIHKGDIDIVLISSSYFCKFIDRYKVVHEALHWHRVIIDEGDSIRCPDMRLINYRFAWFITATWESLGIPRCNGLIKKIFKNYPICFIKRLVIEKNEEFFQELFSNINIQNINYRCLAPISYISEISHLISPNILEMINANNFNGAIRELGGKVGSSQEISDVLTENIRTRLNKLIYDRKCKEESPYIVNDAKTQILVKFDEQINSLESQLESINNRIINLNDEECSICCCSYTEPVCLECSHIFCSQCIFKWIEIRTRIHQQAQCPFCKKNINVNNMLRIDKNAKKEEKGKKQEIFGKDETIIKIIEKNPNGKFIIFSNYYESFDSFESLLKQKIKNKKCKRLVGNTNTVAKILRDFENGNINVILLNSQHNGAGIDLPTATHIILYHKMREDLEKQVIGRALRIGRLKSLPLNIHRLKYDNELDNEFDCEFDDLYH